jgi:LPS-assembly protein
MVMAADPAAPSLAPNADQPKVVIRNLTSQSEIEFSEEQQVWIGRHGIRVTYGEIEILADQVALSEESGDVIADGNVRMKRGGEYWVGPHFEYNFKTKVMESGPFKAGMAPFYVQGFGLEASPEDNTYTAKKASVTSDDDSNPNHRVRADELTVIPGESIAARNATVYLGKTPVMFLPSYHRTLKSHRNFWVLTPGYRSLWGAHLLSAYHFRLTDSLSGSLNGDLYEKRGLGIGPKLSWNSEKWGKGEIQGYYIQDQDPKPIPRTAPALDPDRHRIHFTHQVNLRDNLTVKLAVREQGDRQMLRDFFEDEYRRNSQPSSFLEVNQLWSNYSLNVLAQPQVNDFFETVERLPDVKLSGLRQQIGVSPLYYENETSAAYLRFQPGLTGGTNYAAGRADSYHQVILPQTYLGWLNVAPRVGGRFTHYTETDGGGVNFNDENRFVFNTGAEVSTKASRVWKGLQNRAFEMDGLRHIVQPSINYVFVPSPSVLPRELPQFDREIPSLRLLPIEYPDYNAVDAIDSQNVVRFSLRNKLQTKRGGEVDNLVNWMAATDWRINPKTGQADFSNLYSDMDFKPRSWLTINSETRMDLENAEFIGANHSATINPNSTWSWKVGHRYFTGEPALGPNSGNNIIYQSFYFRLNENWAGRVTHHFEARDGTMEEQYYTVYRDFRSWTGALTVRFRENRFGEDDFAVAFTFSLKAFPRFKLGDDTNRPELLLGG